MAEGSWREPGPLFVAVAASRLASAAAAPAHRAARRLVEMQMIGMRGVIIGRKHGREKVACAAADFAQEGGILTCVRPVAKHADAPAAGKAKAGDVERIGGSMLAERALGTPVEATTRIASEMIDARDSLAEVPLGGRLDHVALPQDERGGHGAGGD